MPIFTDNYILWLVFMVFIMTVDFLSHIQEAINIIAENSFHLWVMDPKRGLDCMKTAIDNFLDARIAAQIRQPISDAVEVCLLYFKLLAVALTTCKECMEARVRQS